MTRNPGRVLVLLFPLACIGQPAYVDSTWRAALPGEVRVVLVWSAGASGPDSVDQNSFATALRSMGFIIAQFESDRLRAASLDSATLLVLPHAAAQMLSLQDAQAVMAGVRKGMRLVTDGPSRLLDALGVTLGKAEYVTTVKDRGLPDVGFRWSDRPLVETVAGFSRKRAHVLYADSGSGHPLGIMLRVGQGRCLIFAPLFDPLSGSGYSRFPTLPNAIAEELKCSPLCRRNALDVYFDPGYRYSVPVEELASQWQGWGIRAIHAAAWYYCSTPPYDYRRLIDAAHKNGIVVYAWLEWPHVGPGFWDKHPEWRQKNALLQDAKLDFLHLMDLQNTDCLNEALSDLRKLLTEDWDGIDIAEFTITGAGGEALAGPSRPDYFVPFTSSAIAEFKRSSGFDSRELTDSTSRYFWQRNPSALDQFYHYRTVVNNRLLRRVVEFVSGLNKEGNRDWEIIHTIVDHSLHPEFDYLLGFDQKTTLHLLDEFGVTLNVEDPYMEWVQPPERYSKLRHLLVSLIPGRPSMIDINVVPIHPANQPGFATAQATGIEFLLQLQKAGEGQGRVCVYCESSVFPHDWRHVPSAMSVGVSVRQTDAGWEITCGNTVALKISDSLGVRLDDGPWPCQGPYGVIIPPGSHRISFGSRAVRTSSVPAPFRLLFLSGELLQCNASGKTISLAYQSPSRCLLAFNKPPADIHIDGSTARVPVFRGENAFVVAAPSGAHRISVSWK